MASFSLEHEQWVIFCKNHIHVKLSTVIIHVTDATVAIYFCKMKRYYLPLLDIFISRAILLLWEIILEGKLKILLFLLFYYTSVLNCLNMILHSEP